MALFTLFPGVTAVLLLLLLLLSMLVDFLSGPYCVSHGIRSPQSAHALTQYASPCLL